MPTKGPWDDARAGQALAKAMADTYGLSQEAVLDWYQRAINALENLDRARNAVKGLIEEPFVVAEYRYRERDQDAYHAHYWSMLKEAVGLAESFCAVCGQWYPRGTHTCQSFSTPLT